MAIGLKGLGFDSQADRIIHSVANGSPVPIAVTFLQSYAAQALCHKNELCYLLQASMQFGQYNEECINETLLN